MFLFSLGQNRLWDRLDVRPVVTKGSFDYVKGPKLQSGCSHPSSGKVKNGEKCPPFPHASYWRDDLLEE
jgi:hypothetical protein